MPAGVCLRFGAVLFRNAAQSALKSTYRLIRRQRLSHIRLRNPELSCDPRRRDASFERRTDGIQLRVNGTSAVFACRRWDVLSVDGARFAIESDGRQDDGIDSASVLHRRLRRRLASSTATSQSSSNSSSLSWATACRRFLGKTWRWMEASAIGSAAAVGFVADEKASRTISVENRSGAPCLARSCLMASFCSTDVEIQ